MTSQRDLDSLQTFGNHTGNFEIIDGEVVVRTKAELVEVIAEKAGITKKAAGEALSAFVQAIQGELKKKDTKVSVAGLGTFSVSKRKARAGVNPRTGKRITIPAMTAPRFSASKALKESAKKSQ